MRLSKLDYLLSILGMFLIALSSLQLLNRNTHQVGEGIGSFENISKSVKSRLQNQIFWATSNLGDEVSNNQLVFTGQDSLASVKLHDGNELIIKENSLIKISKNAVNLVQGELSTQINSGGLAISVGDKEVVITSDDALLNIQKTEEKTLIGVEKGTAKLDDKSGAVELTVDTIVSLEKEKIVAKEVYQFEVFPRPRAQMLSQEDALNVSFSNVAGELIVSTTSDFLHPIRTQERELKLKEGRYFWQIVDANKESQIFYFDIIKDDIPNIILPRDGAFMEVAALPAEIILQWSHKNRDQYLVEVEGMGQKLEMEGGNGLKRISILQSGNYSWRVRKKMEGISFSWSPWQHFTVSEFADIIPANIHPKTTKIESFEPQNESVKFTWNFDGMSEVEISSAQDKEIFEAKNEWTFKNLSEGIYQFRVRAISPRGNKGKWSESSLVEVVDLSKVTTFKSSTVYLTRPNETIALNWNKRGEQYRFELARDSSFSEIIYSQETSNEEIELKVPELGKYYWRYHYFQDGQWKPTVPNILEVEPKKKLKQPRAPKKIKVPLKVESKKSSFGFFSSAWASTGGSITVELPAEEDIKHYRLVIYQNEKLDKVLFDIKQEGTRFVWKNAQPGVYYFQYYLVDHWDRETPPSEPSVLEVTAEHLKPQKVEKLSLKVVSHQEVRVVWKEDAKAAFYILEVSNDKDFSKVQTHTLKDNEFSLKVNPNRYFLRVKGINDFGEGEFSSRRFVIKKQELPKVVEKSHQLYALWRPMKSKARFFLSRDQGLVEGDTVASFGLRYEYAKDYYAIAAFDYGRGFVYDDQGFHYTSGEVTLGKKIIDRSFKLMFGLTSRLIEGREFELQQKMITRPHVNLLYGAHARLSYQMQGSAFHFDQYLYSGSLHFFDTQLSYRITSTFPNYYLGLGRVFYDGINQKRENLYLNLGLGLSF